MPLRKRISLVAATTVAFAVAIAVIVCFIAVRDQMVGQIDSELRSQADSGQSQPNPANDYPNLSANAGGPTPYGRVVWTSGRTSPIQGMADLQFPQTAAAERVASGQSGPYLTDVWVDGAHLRMYTFRAVVGDQGYVAVQLARPLAAVDNVLSTLKWILLGVFLLVVALAAILARLATRRVLKPLAEVTATAQLIGETDDLSQRIDVHEDDEVGQLAGSFNEMLERLESSRAELDSSVTAQRQLVADASHELRTPVTSLRTNVEVLLSGAQLDDDDRDRLLADIVEQSEELSALVTDLIEVARGDTPPTNVEDTRLDRLVEEGIDRARRNTTDVEFVEDLRPVSVQGSPERLMRAINNLLDNAALHGGRRGPVEVSVDQTGLTVRDHGDGIPEADLSHVFDRFFRGANSRSRQGSGLGLAIVSQVAQQHHGTITAANAPDGGAVFKLQLPTTPATDDARVTHHAELSA
jgi:two-component system, OmpR family, sensor histidine kinase MprB